MKSYKMKSSQIFKLEVYLLFLVFLALKLCGVIAWSWWCVFMPLILPSAAFFVCAVIVRFVAAVNS